MGQVGDLKLQLKNQTKLVKLANTNLTVSTNSIRSKSKSVNKYEIRQKAMKIIQKGSMVFDRKGKAINRSTSRDSDSMISAIHNTASKEIGGGDQS